MNQVGQMPCPVDASPLTEGFYLLLHALAPMSTLMYFIVPTIHSQNIPKFI
jgi:hypothetical protein